MEISKAYKSEFQKLMFTFAQLPLILVAMVMKIWEF